MKQTRHHRKRTQPNGRDSTYTPSPVQRKNSEEAAFNSVDQAPPSEERRSTELSLSSTTSPAEHKKSEEAVFNYLWIYTDRDRTTEQARGRASWRAGVISVF